MLKILFIGDINGKIGRQAVAKILPKLKKSLKIDLVIANAENIAHGSGVTEETIKELQAAGVDYMTTGDHAFKTKRDSCVFENLPVLRPANFPPGLPGRGYFVFEYKGKKIALINLIGRVFMHMDYDCPFRKLDEILAELDLQGNKLSAIIVDIHAEATSEKIALGHYVDGRVTAVLGTHTHVMTADSHITDKGMAYITDVGMVGASDSCIGVDKENIIKTFLTQIKYKHIIPEKGQAIFNSVLININEKNSRASSIKSIIKFINIE
jgi:2',3'-cyclic-nucleotide 2'-phosphodiesterase